MVSVLYCAHLCMKCSLSISDFFLREPRLSHSIVFLYFFFPHCSLRKAFLSLLAILWNSAFRWVYLSFSLLSFTFLLSSAICTEKAMAPHSSTLTWKISWTAEPGGLLSMGLHRVRHDWSDLAAAAAASCKVPQTSIWKLRMFWNY